MYANPQKERDCGAPFGERIPRRHSALFFFAQNEARWASGFHVWIKPGSDGSQIGRFASPERQEADRFREQENQTETQDNRCAPRRKMRSAFRTTA